MGGGTYLEKTFGMEARGLSPRGRGNLGSPPQWPPQTRSIPAWAGEPNPPNPPRSLGTVYPRVGGGTVSRSRVSWSVSGLSPRGRGNRCGVCEEGLEGRSIPAWAGNRTPLAAPLGYKRSIPAWAGEPFRRSLSDPYPTVYPRVGGGTPDSMAICTPDAGLSPRGRGNR